MKTLTNVAAPILGIGAACLACCAVPISSLALGGLGLGIIGASTLGWIAGLAALLVAGGLVFLRRRSAASRACKPGNDACGCDTSCTVPGKAS
jgi:hypothetical protein